jgi:hypothetical protein
MIKQTLLLLSTFALLNYVQAGPGLYAMYADKKCSGNV